ncbi:MAG: hypothetical protein WBO92_04570 [Candidatus Moraniibacteriota bacterium]
MALAATHMRFALEMKDVLGVRDLEKYLSGSMYPDSRYYSGINREATHDPAPFVNGVMHLDDFRKGWAMHLSCDVAQAEAISHYFPEDLARAESNEEKWIFRTAIKCLQDRDDAKHFDARKYSQMMTCYEGPNGETEEQLSTFYGLFIELYEREQLTLDDEFDVWVRIGMPESGVKLQRQLAARLSRDATVMDCIAKLYNETLTRYRLVSISQEPS